MQNTSDKGCCLTAQRSTSPSNLASCVGTKPHPVIFLGTHTGTEVIVLKAIPLTHCENKVRYYATEVLNPSVNALDTYEVDSITGVVTVKTSITDLRSLKVSPKHF